MKYRKLRMGWSVGWGVVVVMLCVLWVRSYWWIDTVYVHGGIIRVTCHMDQVVADPVAYSSLRYVT